MKKFLIGGVSLFAILSANNAMAAGYTCEELIEYTSCNDGYYLNAGDCIEGATCGAGNYLLASCADGYKYSDNWCFAGEWSSSQSKEECEDSGDTWYGVGCVRYDEDNPDEYHWDESAFNPSAFSTLCIPCDAGTYQPSAGQYSCITCPAGSECPTTTAATLCEAGEWSAAGATACSTCPTHSYTNVSGQTVTIAATSVAGAGSATACYIDPDTYFTDQIGTYHFKENCTYKGAGLTYEAACELNCAQNQDSCNDYGERHCGCSDDEMSEVFVLDSDTGEFFCWSETEVFQNGYDYNTYKSECKSTGLRWDDDTHLCYDLNGDVVYRIE